MSNHPNESDPVLCFVKDHMWAFFTKKALHEQSGCDWNDRPYQFNASVPHGEDEGTITRVAFHGDFETPENFSDNLSAEDINSGVIAWVVGSRWADDVVKKVTIPAGTPLSEFKRRIQQAGGKVFVEEKSE